MQKDEVVVLPVVPSYIRDLWSLLTPLARNKTVLNIGAAGDVEYYLDGRRDLWMHERLKSLASAVVGSDTDEITVGHGKI